MNYTQIATQIIETAVASKKNVLVKIDDFDCPVSSLLIILYRKRADLGHKDTIAFSNKDGRFMTIYYGATETVAFTKENLKNPIEELVVVDSTDRAFSGTPIRVHWKTKLNASTLSALRVLLDAGITSAVELHGMNDENFSLLFPQQKDAFMRFDKEKFLLLL